MYSISSALASAGYKVALVAQNSENETVDGVNIIALPEPRNRRQRMVELVFEVLRLARKQKADIYHFHTPELIIVGVILKILGRKVICDVHEDSPKSILPKHYLPKLSRKFLSFAVGSMEEAASRIFDLVITATDRIQQNFPNSCGCIHERSLALLQFCTDTHSTQGYRINGKQHDEKDMSFLHSSSIL